MTASVANLLNRLHAQAFRISALDTEPSDGRWRAQSVVWPKLARAANRAVSNVPTGTASDPELVLVDSVLRPIAGDHWFSRAPDETVPNVPPDKRLVDMTRVLGSIADLLTMGPSWVGDDPTEVLGLRANLLAPVMVAANWSLATAPDVLENMTARRHLQLVSGIGAAFAFIPPALRPGRYDDIAAVPHAENSLDAAVHNWLDAVKEALATRKGLSGVTLQTIAADLSIICGAAAAMTNAAIATGGLAEERGRPVVEAMSEANAKWRSAAVWPQSIYLGGVRDAGLAAASMSLRRTVIKILRDGRSWADPQVILKRIPSLYLLAVARRAMNAAQEAGELHHDAIRNLTSGKDQLMMAARALEGSAHMNTVVFEARRRGDWIPMPRAEPSGVELHRAATSAANATVSARLLAVAAAKAAAARPGPSFASAVDCARGRIGVPGTATPESPAQRLVKVPPCGIGSGGPVEPTRGPALPR